MEDDISAAAISDLLRTSSFAGAPVFRHSSASKQEENMRALLLIAALGMAAAPVSAAKPCRDAHGKFMKCATPAKPKACRDAKGHFIKCKK